MQTCVPLRCWMGGHLTADTRVLRAPEVLPVATGEPALSSQALRIADDAAMNGSKAARKYIERRAMCFGACPVMLTEVNSGPPRTRQEQSNVCAIYGDEDGIPRLVKGRNLFGTHAQQLCTVCRGWRGASQSHAGDSACDDLRNDQPKLNRLSGKPGGSTAATAWHKTVCAVARR